MKVAGCGLRVINSYKKKSKMSYKNLEIWKLAEEVAIDIHQMTIQDIPKFEMFEVGSQIRRSSKSTKSCIVEGFGRRRYKADFIKFLIYAHSSNDETMDHIETLFKTNSLKDRELYEKISAKLDLLGKKISLFIKGVERTDWHS